MIKWFVLIFILIFSPVYSEETQQKQNFALLIDWNPLPDGTMLLKFGNKYYRHHILSSSQKSECSEVIVRENVIALITRPNFQTWEYIISKKPVFYSKDGKKWVWLEKINE